MTSSVLLIWIYVFTKKKKKKKNTTTEASTIKHLNWKCLIFLNKPVRFSVSHIPVLV